jgi:hypothetical protein
VTYEWYLGWEESKRANAFVIVLKSTLLFCQDVKYSCYKD